MARAQTAPLLWENITDAESGEALELRRPKWEIPPQAKRRTDAAVSGGNGGDGCRGADRRRSGEMAKNRTDVEERYERLGPWFGEEEDGSWQPCAGVRLEDRPAHAMRGGAVRGVATEGGNKGRGGPPTTTTSTSSNETFSCSSAPSFPTRVPWRDLPACEDVDGGSGSSEMFTDSPTVGDSPGSSTFAEEREPLTPRPTERLHSPFWVPPPQEPPFFHRPPSRVRARAAARSPDGHAGNDANDGDGGTVSGTPSSAVPPLCRHQQASPQLSRLSVSPVTNVAQKKRFCSSEIRRTVDGGGANRWPSDDDSARRPWVSRTKGSSRGAIPEAVPDDVRVKMAQAQETRDRYLRCVQSC